MSGARRKERGKKVSEDRSGKETVGGIMEGPERLPARRGREAGRCSPHARHGELLSLLPCDHMFNEPLDEAFLSRVRDVVERETGMRPAGPIRLLTNLRVLGVESTR